MHNKSFTRIFALLLSVALVCTAVPMPVFAQAAEQTLPAEQVVVDDPTEGSSEPTQATDATESAQPVQPVTDDPNVIPTEDPNTPSEDPNAPSESPSTPTEETIPEDVEIPDDDGGDGTQTPGGDGGGEGGEPEDIYANAVEVASVDELTDALLLGEKAIRIVADLTVDRTFYVSQSTVIFTDQAHTLTRAPGFAGDIFVVGETGEGVLCENSVTLTLGHPESSEKNLLVIDGNKDNLTTTVTGSVFFVVGGATVALYENVTVSNHKKAGNEKTLTEKYGVSYPGRIGGAVAIISAGANMDIFGGTYENNTVNDFGDTTTEEGQVCTYGGAIYNFGKLNIYGGVFRNNHAGRGGAIYCYRTTKIYNAQLIGNASSTFGGAIYMPNSTGAYLYLGGENSHSDSNVLFKENTAVSGGGAIYARHKLEGQDAQFVSNTVTGGNGGAIYGGEMELILTDCVFDGNAATKHGGAVYYTASNGKDGVDDLSCTDTVFKNNTTATNGGAVYMSGGANAYLENASFTLNTASNGGAIYLSSSHIRMDGGSFTQNSTTATGGAIALYSGASARLSQITATANSGKSGGFAYAEEAEVYLYDSYMAENTSSAGGAALCFQAGASGGVYATTFHQNVAAGNGGALFVYTNGYTNENKLVVHSCTFTENQAAYGGAIYASSRSVIDLFNTTAKQNSATKGGFLYHTTTNTIINLAAITLQGNTATDGGPIIWGNSAGAILNLDKSMYLDKDVSGVLDDAYWAAAIVNSLKVKDAIIEIPNYTDFGGAEIVPELPRIPVDITSAEALEKALADGRDLLRIDADFQIDRTFYIYRKTTIYSVNPHTLTRAPGFAGDIFVVGERSDGTLCENAVTLTMGDPESTQKDMLVIDGNKDNLTTTVTGSVLFVVDGACVDLYENVTIQNNKKLGNEKTLTNNYGVSYVNQVGGAMAILAAGASMNIYGGTYANNIANDVAGGDSNHGGAIYNFGKLNIYGGTFQSNYAARGGVIYCYRTTNIYNAQIKNNSASTMGGAVYMPNSTGAVLNVGIQNDLVESSVTFEGNSADDNGGVIFGANKITLENATFHKNSAGVSGGVLISNAVAVIRDCTFTENTAGTHGGAICVNGHNTQEKDTDLTVTGCSFTSNSSTNNGGAIYITGTGVALVQNNTFTTNSGAAGGAIYSTNGTLTVEGGTFTENAALTGNGGAIALYTGTVGVLNKITATKNHTDKASGGAIFVKNSSLTMFRSKLQENTSAVGGAGVYMDSGASGSIYATDFIKNAASANGGGAFLYTNTGEVLLHSCNFTENSGDYGGALYASNKAIVTVYNITATNNSALKGGFLYETTTGTTLTLVGATISGNTATDGGPIIWGNSVGAVLNLDKSQFVDLDHTGELDDAYWAAAIVNKLTVKDISQEIPKWLDYQEESYEHMQDAVDVSTAQQLEDAIGSGAPYIRIIADIEIDRSFFITGNTTIFSTLPRKLTRAPGFGGDIFVVGENAQGESALILGGNAKLVLGNPLSQKEDLLTIDGNQENMTVPVVGSALFICYSASADLHTNVTFCNTYKSDNVRTYNPVYKLSIANRIGGPLAVVASGSLNIYGGNYRDNRVNEEDTSSEETRISTTGGLIHNNGNVYIYGGTFANNQAARGGVVYNYRSVNIYGGSFLNNVATVSGGVYYAPNTAAVRAYIGSADADGAKVLFQGNRSLLSHGGAFFSSALCSMVIYGNTTFDANSSASSGGAISSYGQLTARNVTFSGNIADNRGGAVYAANSNANYITRFNNFEGCNFKNNRAATGGALSVYAGSKDFDHGGIAMVTDCKFTGNMADSLSSKTAASYGGAIYMERHASLIMKGSVLKQNIARTEGGAIYAGGGSTLEITDSSFNQNSIMDYGKHGGAISIHSVTLDLTATNFTGNTAYLQAGALYISYASALDRNSEVTITGGTFKNNTSTKGLGGAIYATRHAVTEEKQILRVSGTDFTGNTAPEGGAMCFSGSSSAYMTDTTFSKNQSTEGIGGAIYNASGIIELDTASFTENAAIGSGGAIAQEGGNVVLYNITATGNASQGAGGFLYGKSGTLTVYDSQIQNNTAVNNAGGIALYAGMLANIYATAFTSNTSQASGGGLFLYTDGTEVLVHSCSFTGNQGGNGGAIYASNASIGKLYNITATGNKSTKGGFLYETTTGTTLDLVGATVSGNTATSGGPVIWGNSVGAVLNLDKSQFVDLDHTGEMDDAYWAAAIVNKLTVNQISAQIPTYEPYQSKRDGEITPPAVKDPVSVQDVFDVATKPASDADINSTYAKFPRLDNSSNFMSKNVTTFENINGKTVTVDSFIYPTKGIADNCNVGMGLLIWQAICYKQANPEQEVYIDTSSYRFSVQAAVNINRDSRYFGYMRQLDGKNNYDQYGFVRIAYLLITAAKMGIHVNVIGHQDAYPVSANSLQLYDYFTTQLNNPCDPDYVENGVIRDYLDFTMVDWTLQNKGGTDMMHNKMCAVSHYLDMNGVAHEKAVWSSSTNLDGINASGTNANWKLQTGTIITNHDAIYETSVNYLRLIPQYKGQEEIYEFQKLVNNRSTQQAQMILAGQEDQIPAGEQIIYLGRDTDPVFELYFTPLGGDLLNWDEVNNPYCKYLRKLYNSEDYIVFTWNAAEYNGNFTLGQQIEEMIVAAFHENRNVNNKIYANMEYFDTSTFNDLKVGVDIGYKNLNKWPLGMVHNKDVSFSYVENGQRYYVSLLNSMNMHSGSMYYQSNFALVIKETALTEDSVYFTMLDNTTVGIVDHAWSDQVLEYIPETGEDGYTYHPCTKCDEKQVLDTIHRPGQWTVVSAATAEQNGITARSCTACGVLMDTREYAFPGEATEMNLQDATGKTFSQTRSAEDVLSVSGTLQTIEATVQLNKSVNSRGGVIVGNYDNSSKDQLNLEIYTYGRPRLFVIKDGVRSEYLFQTDIRSNKPVHLAVTLEDTCAKLYVNGDLAETVSAAIPALELTGNIHIGGDARKDNLQYFRGTVYSVHLFADVRTPEALIRDAIAVFSNEPGLLATKYYIRAQRTSETVSPAGKTFAPQDDLNTDTLTATPLTLEAVLHIPTGQKERAGTILGNYDGAVGPRMNLEIHDGGRVRLWLHNGTASGYCLFGKDIRSDDPVHIAVVVNGSKALLYINGALAETKNMPFAMPQISGKLRIGGDYRSENTQYFKGTLYAVSLFDTVRTAQQIKSDAVLVHASTPNLLYTRYFAQTSSAQASSGRLFSSTTGHSAGNLTATPKTIEATVQLNKNYSNRGGVIVGNYDMLPHCVLNLEVYTYGRPRLYTAADDGTRIECTFDVDIRSDKPVHLAVTIDGTEATLYVNGTAAQTKSLSLLPGTATDNYMIGGDHRTGNNQYFKGSIYDVRLFSDLRTPEEIAADCAGSSTDVQDQLLYADFSTQVQTEPVDILPTAQTFTSGTKLYTKKLSATPMTFEAIVQVDPDSKGRPGVIVGNYDNYSATQLNLEIYTGGHPRLFYILPDGTKVNCTFDADIRSDAPTHIAVAVAGLTATLYINGEPVEQKALPVEMPVNTRAMRIGGDNRLFNICFFRGKIYSVSLFSQTRTAAQIKQDALCMNAAQKGVLYSNLFVASSCSLGGHTSSDWIMDTGVSEQGSGISHTECTVCGKLLLCRKIPQISQIISQRDLLHVPGFQPKAEGSIPVDALSAAPLTIEATVQLNKSHSQRAGVIFGNFDSVSNEVINLEVYTNGKLRLYYKTAGIAYSHIFATDIRSDKPVHLALTVEGLTAKLYVNGKLKETVTLSAPLPTAALSNYRIGGDSRTGSQQYFAGTIYSVALFSTVRTPEQIAADRYLPVSTSEGLLLDRFFDDQQ